MDPNRLLSDELTFELRMRRLPVGNTVAEKRAVLREALKEEKSGKTYSFQMNLDFGTELEICRSKLEDLEKDVLRFNHSNRENEFKRIFSRLLHVTSRLDQLTGNVMKDEVARLEQMNRCTQLIGDLNLVYEGLSSSISRRLGHLMVGQTDAQKDQSILDIENPPIQGSIQEPTVSFDLIQLEQVRSGLQNYQTSKDCYENLCAGPSARSLACHTEDNFSQRPSASKIRFIENEEFSPDLEEISQRATASSSIRAEPHKWVPEPYEQHGGQSYHPSRTFFLPGGGYNERGSIDIYRWSIKFNGKTSVADFLERIEEVRLARGVSHEQLLRAAPEIFTQEALLWYRTKKFTTWSELTSQLREAFRPYDYENSLWDEIRRRSQGAQEKVLTYVVCMENLFRKLDAPPKEHLKLSMIRRNLLPHFQTQLALHHVQSIDELIHLCKAIEETELRVQKFIPPPSSSRHLLEPELAYKRPVSHQAAAVSLVNSNNTQRSGVSESQPPSSSSSFPTRCWNCGKSTHKFRACTEPRRKFCFKCGLEQVTVESCPHCRKNFKRDQK